MTDTQALITNPGMLYYVVRSSIHVSVTHFSFPLHSSCQFYYPVFWSCLTYQNKGQLETMNELIFFFSMLWLSKEYSQSARRIGPG